MRSIAGLALLLATATCVNADTGAPFYGDPPDAHHPWAIHDRNRPQPKVVTPGSFSRAEQPGKPPSDAVVLFDGRDLSEWESDKAGSPVWVVRDGALECVPKSGYLRSKRQFGDCQLHVEWAAPKDVKGDGQGRGNSGIFLMGITEIQVLDNYNNPTYADGMACSNYGVNPPIANALRPPGEFQVVDIIFRRPVYKDGKPVDPGYVTVFCNGVLVLDHSPLEGPTGHMKRTKAGPFPDKGPLRLQDHGNPVRYRNIWYRELPPRTPESGASDGSMTAEATAAKRKEIAAEIRRDADQLGHAESQSSRAMLRYYESLVYDNDPGTAAKARALLEAYAKRVKSSSPEQIESAKTDILDVAKALRYLSKWGILPKDFPPKSELETLIASRGWEKKK